MPQFETFTKTRMKVAVPTVTIQSVGNFSLNGQACTLLGSPAAVRLLYAPKEKIIGFQPCGEDDPNGYILRHQKAGNTWTVAGVSFIRHYGLTSTTARRYTAYLDGDTLCIDVVKGEPTRRGVAPARPAGQSPEPLQEPQPPSRTAEIRAWALRNGYLNSRRPGRIAKDIVEAYDAVEGRDVPKGAPRLQSV